MVVSDLPSRLSRERLRLVVITDARLAAPRSVEEVVEAALLAGAPTVQLRDKGLSVARVLPLARRLRILTHRHRALLIVNDRLDLALAVGADGVHLGPEDLPVAAVRAVVSDTFIVGCSADDPRAARQAEADGADYLGCGTVWPTTSKPDAGDVIGIEGLKRVVSAVAIPVVAIGGIDAGRAAGLPGSVAGVAVIGAVMSAGDPGLAVQQLLGALG